MTDKEAHTSSLVKGLIIKVSSVSDDQCEGAYQKETGGILTIQLELGEPILKIATCAVKLWRETILCLIRLMYITHQKMLIKNLCTKSMEHPRKNQKLLFAALRP